MAVSVEEVSSSVVREYLSRKGLKRTIACMDEEHPRTEASINNRSHLRQVLNMEGLYRKNKAVSSPLKTLLEIIVKYHIEGFKNDKITCSESDAVWSARTVSSIANSAAATPAVMSDVKAEVDTAAFVVSKHNKLRSAVGEVSPSQPIYTSLLPETDRLSSQNQTGFWAHDLEDEKGQTLMASLQDKESFMKREPEKKTSITESTQRSRTNRIRRGMMAGPIASTPQESNKKRQYRKVEVCQPLLRKEEESRQFEDGLLTTAVHQKSSESSQTEIGPADCVRRQQELWSAPDRKQRENSFEKVKQDTQMTTKLKSLIRPNVADLDVSEMVLDDIDDDDLREFSKVSFQRTAEEHHYAGRPMDQHAAMELKAVLLGSSLNCFSVEWRNQGFTFSETHDLRYGIVQRKVVLTEPCC